MMNPLDETEQLLVQCEKDLQRIQAIQDELKKIESNRAKLADYYQKQYKKDYETAASHDKHYRILDQDSIWNILDEQYREKIQLIKNITQSI